MNKFVEHPFIKKESVEYRVYQDALVKGILEKGNTLVVAPTALGKTVIAVLLAAEVLQKDSKKKILFVAPTKPLAAQHEKSFKGFLEIPEEKITLLTGTLGAEKRAKAWENACIVCATPQAIENDIMNGKLDFSEVSLMIFDEAHRAVGNYSYVFIAKKFASTNPNGLIVGLTASPGHEEERIQDVARNLFIKNIEIKGREDEDVKDYTNEIDVKWLKLDLPLEILEVRECIENFIKEQLELLRRIGYARDMKTNNLSKKRLLDLQGKLRRDIASKARENPMVFVAISRAAALLKASHAHTLAETQGLFAFKQYIERTKETSLGSGASKADVFFVNHPEMKKALSLCEKALAQGIDHPKIDALKRILSEQFKANPDSRVLVFNHYRDSIKRIEDALSEIQGISAKKFVGQADKGNEKGLKQKEQIELVQDFRDGKYNVLLCSSVAEEGIDIPSVDLVIFYEPVPSEIRTIQRRGRTGRTDKGKVIILLAKGTKDEAFYWTASSKERKMKRMLHEMKSESTHSQQTMQANACEKSQNALPKQQTLINYTSGKPEERVIVYIDYREQRSSVAKELMELGCEVVLKQLSVADYLLSDAAAVERKSVEDFLQSIVDGRLFPQAKSLTENFSKPLLILEGNFSELYYARNINKAAVIGALSSLMLDYRLPIYPVKDYKETAEVIFSIAKREQLGKEKDIKLRIGRKGRNLGEKQRFIAESLPAIGPKLAKKLLREFKSIKNIANASEIELKKTDGMGDSKAKGVWETLNKEYKEEE